MPSWEFFLFSPNPPKSLIMSCRAIYDLRHVSHDAPSVCPAMTEGPASSHSCRTAPSLTSDCRYLYIKTMPCQSELVCPSPWVEPCHYSAHTQERRRLFSTCYRKCNIGVSSKAAGTETCRVYRCLAFVDYQFVEKLSRKFCTKHVGTLSLWVNTAVNCNFLHPKTPCLWIALEVALTRQHKVNQSSWNWSDDNHCLVKHISLANVDRMSANSKEQIMFSIDNVKITLLPMRGLCDNGSLDASYLKLQPKSS